MRAYILCALLVATVAGLPEQKIIGGIEAEISSHPYAAVLMRYNSNTGSYEQRCAGSIINSRSILTSVNCVLWMRGYAAAGAAAAGGAVRSHQLARNDSPRLWSARLGSSLANSGGVLYTVESFIIHPQYTVYNNDNDVAILRTQKFITYGPNITNIGIAGPGYILGDNTPVTIVGWGAIGYEQERSNQLLKADIGIINHTTCRQNYNIISMEVTDNMICAGSPSGGVDFCEGDFGSALVHNNTVLVGIASWRTYYSCGLAEYPGVYTSVNKHTAWIQSNA
ncbi:unnamed protein product [Colias eurytheme]|nr:unnamed protein product [Colias eurytheme]